MINIGICDDIREIRQTVRDMCERYSGENNVSFSYKEFSSGAEVLEYSGQIDIMFQDIVLPKINGIDVMEKIIDMDNIELVIFVSGYSSYYSEVFSVKTRGFIEKPVEYWNFEKNLRKVISELERRKIIKFKTEKGIVFVRSSNLVYIQTLGNYLKVFCRDKTEYIVYGSMKKWSEFLENYGIIRVSSSYMVNMLYICGWDKTLKPEKTDIKIHVGKGFYEKGKELYHDYIKKIL